MIENKFIDLIEQRKEDLRLRWTDFFPVIGLVRYNSRSEEETDSIVSCSDESHNAGVAMRKFILYAYNFVPWGYGVYKGIEAIADKF